MTPSMIILNNFGGIGHPCFTPRFICISSLLTDVFLAKFYLHLYKQLRLLLLYTV